ncbi:MAG: biopolymer transporter ExbD [Bacteroidaceae bacterium]|nr:biopolymer transporter ExbD [Bacteroidaceae bacterium]
MPELNTSSLPDLIFSILFFFMIVTSMREEEVKIEFKLPKGTGLSKIERKTAVVNIHIGSPSKQYVSQFGTSTRVQLNDRFANVKDVAPFVINERSLMRQADQAIMKVALKADQNVQMGIMTDVKMELRHARALSIMYSAEERNKQ